jgi:hypothetical protein
MFAQGKIAIPIDLPALPEHCVIIRACTSACSGFFPLSFQISFEQKIIDAQKDAEKWKTHGFQRGLQNLRPDIFAQQPTAGDVRAASVFAHREIWSIMLDNLGACDNCASFLVKKSHAALAIGIEGGFL